MWLKVIAPDEPEKLRRRLQWDDLQVTSILESFRSAGEPTASGEFENGIPGWCLGLQEIRTALQHGADTALVSPEDPLVKEPQLPFVDLWLPARDRGIFELRELCNQANLDSQISDEAFDDLGRSLLQRLVNVGEQALWKEFSESRSPGDVLAAHLITKNAQAEGPPRDLYIQFIHRHRKQGIEQLLDKYPVLGRFLGTVWILWLEASIEMLMRIANDREAISRTFGIPTGIPIQNIQQGLSDPHRGGRVVSIVTFVTAGSARKIVYKPKDMTLDKTYQAALKGLSRHSDMSPLKTVAVLCGDGYGYMEFVPHALCRNQQELDGFYFNAGRLTAVLHILGCTDCHHENLIANGEHLVFIDTETLFEDYVPGHGAETETENDASPIGELRRQFHGSVLRSGLIPMWRFIGPQNIAIDMSALGVHSPSQSTGLLPGWLALNCDGMMAGHIEHPVEVPTSLPVGIGSKNPFKVYVDRFCEGFQRQCAELIAHRSDWVSTGGVLEQFSGIPRRFVFRATRVYWALQRQQLEPAALQSSLDQFMKLEKLARSFLLASERPEDWPIFASEVMQMSQLDIPFFEQPVNGIPSAVSGDTAGRDVFSNTSGLDASVKRLAELDAEAIELQIRLMRGSCAARVLRETANDSSPSNAFSDDQPPRSVTLTQQEKLSQACGVMKTLLELAIWDRNNDVDWLGIDIGADGEKFSFGPVGLSLYSGSSGVALFCARLARLSDSFALDIDDKLLDRIICSILTPIREFTEETFGDGRVRWWRDQPLGINGCGGVLLMLSGLDKEGWTSPGLQPRELALGLLEGAQGKFLQQDSQLDIIGGSAGLIGALIQLGTSKSLELAAVAGERLIEAQQERGGWRVRGPQSPMLLGFSHGTAGFAAALARLHHVTGERRFLNAARRALTYERQKFDPRQGNWPDFRGSPGAVGRDSEGNCFMTSWCHGAPGIALGRTCLWGTALWDEHIDEEIKIGLTTTASMPMLDADHICCGSSGLAATLRYVGSGPWINSKADREAWCLRSEELIEKSLARRAAHEGQFNCFGVREGNLLMPGFFTGLSGIGLLLTSDTDQETLIPQLMTSGLFYAEN